MLPEGVGDLTRFLFVSQMVAFIGVALLDILSGDVRLNRLIERTWDLHTLDSSSLAGFVPTIRRKTRTFLFKHFLEQHFAVLELDDSVAVLDASQRIDGDNEFAPARRAGVGLVSFTGLETERIPKEGPSKQLDHQRDVGSLEAPEGKLRSRERLLRISRRRSIWPDRPSLWKRLAGSGGGADFRRARWRWRPDRKRAAVYCDAAKQTPSDWSQTTAWSRLRERRRGSLRQTQSRPDPDPQAPRLPAQGERRSMQCSK